MVRDWSVWKHKSAENMSNSHLHQSGTVVSHENARRSARVRAQVKLSGVARLQQRRRAYGALESTSESNGVYTLWRSPTLEENAQLAIYAPKDASAHTHGA